MIFFFSFTLFFFLVLSLYVLFLFNTYVYTLFLRYIIIGLEEDAPAPLVRAVLGALRTLAQLPQHLLQWVFITGGCSGRGVQWMGAVGGWCSGWG